MNNIKIRSKWDLTLKEEDLTPFFDFSLYSLC